MIVEQATISLLRPEIILLLAATIIYLGGTAFPSRSWWTAFSVIAYAMAGWVMFAAEGSLWEPLQRGELAGSSGPLVLDTLGFLLRWVSLVLGVLFTLFYWRGATEKLGGEVLGSLMLVLVGLMLVVRAHDLVFLFVALELISIPTYVLLFLGDRGRAGAESTVKYFYLSIFSSSLLLFGFSFLYGFAGTTSLAGLSQSVALMDAGLQPLLPLALVLVFAGLGFKMAAVPMHFYAPDVYQGTSSANAALLAVVPKIAGVVVTLRLFALGLADAGPFAWRLLLIMAVATMTLGNICALWQTNLRRLMAYSSIAHAGYMLIGVTVATVTGAGDLRFGGMAATVFYLVVYGFASLGTFAALAYLGNGRRDIESLDELAGLGRTHPWAGGALAVFMFSLAGIPPLAGFWGKLGLFTGAVEVAGSEHPGANWLAGLAILGAVNAAIAAAYYLRVVATVFFARQSDRPVRAAGGAGALACMVASGILVLALGAFPGTALRNAGQAEESARQAVRAFPPAAEVTDQVTTPRRR